MNKVIACEHVCSSDCRREGCNCACGEFHQVASALKVQHLPSDYQDAPSVDELLAHIGKQTGITPELLQDVADDEGDSSNADYKPGYDDGEAEPSDEEADFE
jgi:hypothetical protein